MGEPRRIDLRNRPAPDIDIVPFVEHLRAGGLLVYPTETVYGIGCVLDPEPLARLQRFKSRGPSSPFLLLVPGRESVPGLVWSAGASEMARVFWPGALTLVLADPGGRFPPPVRSARGGVAIRQTSHPLAARLVDALGAPLTSTSANAHGEPPARTGEDAMRVAHRVGAGEETWVLDVGTLPWNESSTIVDCMAPIPAVVRAGATPVGRLRCVLPEIHGSH